MTPREGPENLLSLRRDLCCGCTHCLRVCPTEAIRIRRGRAEAIRHRCIECGRCVGACPRGAWKVLADPLEGISKGRSAALLDPAVFGQFGSSFPEVFAALQEMGFAEVNDLGDALEIYAAAGKEYLATEKRSRPAIASFCPAVVGLVQVKFPSLLENLMPIRSPYEIASSHPDSRSGTGPDDLYAVVPCLAQASFLRRLSPQKFRGIISLADTYNSIKARLPRKGVRPGASSEKIPSFLGLRWAAAGGESEALEIRNSLVVDGIHQVAGILDLAESGLLDGVFFIEAWACETGCLGGPLTVENPFIARYHLSQGTAAYAGRRDKGEIKTGWESITRPPLPPRPGMRLDENLKKAMEKLTRIDEVVKNFPGLDCGACGCPTCLALAEDVVQGRARMSDCFHRRKKGIRAGGSRTAGPWQRRGARTTPETGEKNES